jgi:hypothetical protein
MIKHISNKNILTTPFTAVKGWTLFNTISDDLVLIETNDFFVAFEYVNFYITPPILDRVCNIALQYNTNNDAQVEEGISGSGFFYPDTEAQNRSGTYKRLVYAQTAQAFYNTYHNPIQIFGMDNIDFPLSRTNRNLGNQFLLFSISPNVMGHKIVEGSVLMYDLFLDDNATITDDRYGNLIIGNHLFSKIQEVRHIENIIVEGTADTNCPLPITGSTTTSTTSTTTPTTTTSTTSTTTSTTSTTTTPTTTTSTTSTTTPTTTTSTTSTTSTTTTTTTEPPGGWIYAVFQTNETCSYTPADPPGSLGFCGDIGVTGVTTNVYSGTGLINVVETYVQDTACTTVGSTYIDVIKFRYDTVFRDSGGGTDDAYSFNSYGWVTSADPCTSDPHVGSPRSWDFVQNILLNATPVSGTGTSGDPYIFTGA